MSDEFDFGFTAVDEEELGLVSTTPPPPSTPTINVDSLVSALSAKLAELQASIANLKPASSTQLARMEDKIDRVLNAELTELNAAVASQGQSLSSVLDEVEERCNATRGECKEKLIAVERLILPLLTNLMKNPEKPYIKWEGRSEKLSAQINKITEVTRSFGV